MDQYRSLIGWFRFGTIVEKIWKHLVDERADKFGRAGPVELGIEPASRAVAGSRYSGSREHVSVRRG